MRQRRAAKASQNIKVWNKFLIVVNIPSQHVELINLIYNSLLQFGKFSVHAFYMCRYLIIIEIASRPQKRIVHEIDELYLLRRNIYHYKKLIPYFYVLYSQVYISVP